jgi:hypothetical protein
MKFQFLALAIFASSPLLAHATCATQTDTSILPGMTVQRQNVTLEKKYKRVIHRDCNQDIVTDKIEVVGQPISQIQILPTQKLKKPDVDDTKVYNRTTCEDEGFANGLGNIFGELITLPLQPLMSANIAFTVNSESDMFMYVLKNQDNYLDYSFSKCTERLPPEKAGEAGKCKTLQPIEKGVLVLSVKYNIVHENGVDDIAKTEEECKGVNLKDEKRNTKLTRWSNYLSTKLFGATEEN